MDQYCDCSTQFCLIGIKPSSKAVLAISKNVGAITVATAFRRLNLLLKSFLLNISIAEDWGCNPLY
jgi:hypothetical protein